MPANPERRTVTRRQILAAGAAGIGGALAAALGISAAAVAPAERPKSTTTEEQPSPIVINPSFEEGISTPTGWRMMSPVGSVQAWESGIAHTGNRSLSIAGPTPNNIPAKWETTGLISVRPSQPYTLSIWVRSERAFDRTTGRFAVVMWYYDAVGNPLGLGWGPPSSPDPTATWQLYTGSTITPQRAACVLPNLVYLSTSAADHNKVYFDDIALVGPPSPYSIYLPVTIKNASGPTQ